MRPQSSSPGFRVIRRDQLRPEREHDAYKRTKKPPEPCVCPDCGAIFHAGRWQWGASQAGAAEISCPACSRIRDNFPSGFLYVDGSFANLHRQELLNLIQHHADKAKSEHPLSRIISIKADGNGQDTVLVTTTDIHLVRDLGEALHDAYEGELAFHYNEAQNLLRVHWQR